jgi:hypothetical protein
MSKKNSQKQTPAEDAIVKACDWALDAAEAELATRLGNRFASAVKNRALAERFTNHCRTHLEEELQNIAAHGHRNDDPAEVPSAAVPVVISVQGGAVTMVSKPSGVRVEIRDFDIDGFYDEDELAGLPKDKHGQHYARTIAE